MYYYEWCATTHDRRGRMLPASEITGRPGYRSVFAFTECAAAEIRDAGHSRGFDKYPVYAGTLTIDLDDGDVSLASVRAALDARGATYGVWNSGGKGYHVVVQIEPIFGLDVPVRCRALALELAPTCDTSLYSHSSLVRLPGTIHERTGKPKTLVSAHNGTTKHVCPEAPAPAPELTLTDDVLLSFAFETVSKILLGPPISTRRRRTLWAINEDFYRASAPASLALEVLHAVNRTFVVPKDERDVLRVWGSRYK